MAPAPDAADPGRPVAIAACEQWRHAEGELTTLQDDDMRDLARAFGDGAD